MKKLAIRLLVPVLILFWSGDAWSQVEFVDRMNKGFLAQKPELGEKVQDIKLFDEAGNPFNLNKTRGKHTVLIFGCLT